MLRGYFKASLTRDAACRRRYDNAFRRSRLTAIRTALRLHPNMVLACDLDGTLIPLESDEVYRTAIASLSTLLLRHQVTLLYVTGRRLELALDGMTEFKLPNPDFIVSDVGTSIYIRDANGWKNDRSYESLLGQQWGAQTYEHVLHSLEDLPDLRLQEAECQSPFKLSFYLDKPNCASEILALVEKRLNANSILAKCIYSVDPYRGLGLLDVLPPSASKHFALQHLVASFGKTMDEIVYAGDSGNDLEVFLSDARSIIVANTPDWVQRTVKKSASAHSSYFASKKYAAGVLEGCIHFKVFASDYLSITEPE